MDAKSEVLEAIGVQITTSAGEADYPPKRLIWAIASLAGDDPLLGCVADVDRKDPPPKWTALALTERVLINVVVRAVRGPFGPEDGDLASARAVPLSAVASVDAATIDETEDGWNASWVITLHDGTTIPVAGKGKNGRAASDTFGTELLSRLR